MKKSQVTTTAGKLHLYEAFQHLQGDTKCFAESLVHAHKHKVTESDAALNSGSPVLQTFRATDEFAQAVCSAVRFLLRRSAFIHPTLPRCACQAN